MEVNCSLVWRKCLFAWLWGSSPSSGVKKRRTAPTWHASQHTWTNKSCAALLWSTLAPCKRRQHLQSLVWVKPAPRGPTGRSARSRTSEVHSSWQNLWPARNNDNNKKEVDVAPYKTLEHAGSTKKQEKQQATTNSVILKGLFSVVDS